MAAACAQAPISNRQNVPRLNGLPPENLVSLKFAINYLAEWYLFYIFRPWGIRKSHRKSSKSNILSPRDVYTRTSFSRLPHFPEMEEKPFNLSDLGQLGSCLCKYTGNYCILGVVIGQINDRKRSIKSRQNSASSQTSYGDVRLSVLAAHLADCAVPTLKPVSFQRIVCQLGRTFTHR